MNSKEIVRKMLVYILENENATADECLKEFEQLLHNLDNWISVEDELPKERHKKFLTYPDYKILDFDDNKHFIEWSDCCDRFLDVDVTHWQPLPNQPKEKK